MAGTDDSQCIVVGASHAGAQAATRLRRLGWQGQITLIGDEPCVPYHRPPLSKDYLKGNKSLEHIQLHTEEAYANSDVCLKLGSRVEGIDREAKTVTLNDGESLAWDKLILATGSRPRPLPIPGDDLPGVCYLRSIEDVDRIREAASEGGRAVVIGGGYIGLEVAASLRSLGMKVALFEALERILQRVTCPAMSEFFMRVHAEEGVDIRVNTQVTEIGSSAAGKTVTLASGETVDADLIVIGIGIVPNVELAEAAGLATDNGIAVNEFAQTSDPDIYAVGDCASFVHPRYGRSIRLESVQNANEQSVAACKSICGQAEPYGALPWFWSDQYDIKLQIAGLADADCDKVVRGDPASGRSFSILYVKEGKLQAVDAVNRPKDFVFGKKLITEGSAVDVARLADAETELKELVLTS